MPCVLVLLVIFTISKSCTIRLVESKNLWEKYRKGIFKHKMLARWFKCCLLLMRQVSEFFIKKLSKTRIQLHSLFQEKPGKLKSCLDFWAHIRIARPWVSARLWVGLPFLIRHPANRRHLTKVSDENKLMMMEVTIK